MKLINRKTNKQKLVYQKFTWNLNLFTACPQKNVVLEYRDNMILKMANLIALILTN